MKPRLAVYSDCPVFGGADMVAANLLASRAVSERFETVFVHRSHPDFDEGASRRVPARVPRVPLAFPCRVHSLERLEAAWGDGPRLLAAKVLWRAADLLLFPWLVARLWVELRELRVDVLHVNDGGYPGALGCRAAVVAGRLAGARVLLAVHNQTRPRRLPAELLDVLVDPLVGACAGVVVTASTVAQDSLAARLPRGRMRVVPDGVPVPAAVRPAGELRRELGVAPEEPLFAMTAFFEERKGHRVLVEALRRLGAAAPRVALVGNGAELEPVRAAAAAAGVGRRLLFLGYRPDHADVLAACDGLVLPSVHSEDMPLVVLDAMALGKPVVSTRLAGIPAVVLDGETGLLAEPGDPAGLAEALGRLSADPALRRRLGEAGRRRFAERFDAERMAEGYARLYAGLLEE